MVDRGQQPQLKTYVSVGFVSVTAAADSDSMESSEATATCHPQIWSLVYLYRGAYIFVNKNRPRNNLHAAISTLYSTTDLISISAEYTMYVRRGHTRGERQDFFSNLYIVLSSFPLTAALCPFQCM